MKRFLSLLATGLVALSMQAQFLSTPIEIWPNKVTDSLKPKAKHVWDTKAPDHIVEVTSPAIEVFHPKADNSNHQAIVVCPGGAYGILAYIHEGQEIAQWLTSLGYTAYVLSYRVPGQRLGALQDAFRAIRMVRSYGFQKVGIIGFSAGASLSCRAATRWGETCYDPIDKIDQQSQRPDFAMLIYPAYLDEGENHTLSPELTVTKETSPLFVFGTQDDENYGSISSVTILQAMQAKGAPIELHYLVKGGHGYGMRGDGAGKIWPLLAEQWLKTQL